MNDNLKTLLERQVKLIAVAEDFYKKASLGDMELDANILHEYRNCVRAQGDILRDLSINGLTESAHFYENIATANLAVKCVINDCMDILHQAVKIASKRLGTQYGLPISSYYKDYYIVTQVVKELDQIIPKTRGEDRSRRLEIYIEEFTAARASTLHGFLSSIDEIENQMKHAIAETKKKDLAEQKKADFDKEKEDNNWKRAFIASLIAFGGLLIAYFKK